MSFRSMTYRADRRRDPTPNNIADYHRETRRYPELSGAQVCQPGSEASSDSRDGRSCKGTTARDIEAAAIAI